MCLPIQPPDISDAVNNALTNLSDEPTKLLGGMIADLLRIPATKVRLYSQEQCEKLQTAFANRIFDGIREIPIEKLTMPKPQIVGPAIEDSVYCLDSDDLTEMFASLIVNSCNYDYCQYVHPAFSSTIKQLSPYDAMLFKKIAQYDSVSAAQYRKNSKLSNDYSVIHDCIPYTEVPFNDFNLESLSISALKHLGLIEYNIDHRSSLVEKRFSECPFYLGILDFYKHQEFTPTIVSMRIYLTPYGKALTKACSLRPKN